MKFLIILFCFSFSSLRVVAQHTESKSVAPDKTKEVLIVDAACGQCQLGLKGKSCDLAIRRNGKSYFVDGTDIDSHGDAHAKDGFCNAVRKARVQGDIVDSRFKATYFQLAPDLDKTAQPN